MKRFTTHHKTAIILGTLVTAAAFGYYVLFQALFTEIEKTSEITNEVKREERVHNTIATNKQTVVEIQGDLETIDSFFVTSDGVVNFIESVEALARNQGLSIDVRNVSLEEIAGVSYASLLEELQVRIETRGSWQDNYNFLTQLESLPYSINIGLSGVEHLDDSDDPAWRGSFELAVLKLK
jgi:hypothetical protein